MRISELLNSNGDGDGEMGKKRRGGRERIDDDDDDGGHSVTVCFSPGLILWRWFSVRKRRSRESRRSSWRSLSCDGEKENELRVKGKEKEEEDEGSVNQVLPLLHCSTDGLRSEGSSSSTVESCTRPPSEMVPSSGRYTEVTFNMGLVVGLVMFTAISKNEFHKMMELQTQMEMLLNEMQKKNAISKHSESNNNPTFSTTDSQEVDKTNSLSIKDHASSSQLGEAETTMECDQYTKCDMVGKEESLVGMDQLEAELEAELERLQLRLDAEASLENPEQQGIEMGVENSGSSGNLNMSFEEVNDPQEAGCGEHCRIEHYGVCPYELERRLHELLEAQQEEQITELEFALKCTEDKLHEKETELFCWKDTARLYSSKKIDTARLISKHFPVGTCLSR